MSFLPGMSVPLAAFESGGDIVLFAAAQNDVEEITVPLGVRAGDLIVIHDYAQGGGAPDAVTPSGFTLDYNTTQGGARTCISHKIAAGNEGGTVLTCMLAASNLKHLLIFRRGAPFTAVAASSVNSQYTSGDPSAQTILSGAADTPVLSLASWVCLIGEAASRSFLVDGSPGADDEYAPDFGNSDGIVAWRAFLSNPENVAIDMGADGVVQAMHSWFYELT